MLLQSLRNIVDRNAKHIYHGDPKGDPEKMQNDSLLIGQFRKKDPAAA